VQTGVEVWSSAAWRESAVAWLDEQLAGTKRTGEVEQARLQPWGTVLRAPTARGPVWLKATGPTTAFEIELYEILHRAAPRHVLTPIATDPARGWVLLPDGGVPLGERLDGERLVDALAAVTPLYGQLQRDLAPEVGALLEIGIADMRPAIMPTRFDQALKAVRRYLERHGDADELATYERVVALRDAFAEWCARLSLAPGAPSLDHNDLHPWNMLVLDGEAVGNARFYDWGDSVVAHPFASMLQPLGWVQHQLGFGLGAPEILRVRDAYLEVFSDLASHAELVEALELACHVGKAARALTWDRALSALGEEDAGEHAAAPLVCMRALLGDSYLGGA
jgi:Phosphotransferase enzyme family